MKAKDLREKSVEDLRDLEKSVAKDVFQNRFKNFTNRLDDTSLIKKSRRELARIRTLLAERIAPKSPATALASKAAKAAAPPAGPKAEVKAAANASTASKTKKPAAAKPEKAEKTSPSKKAEAK